MLLNVQESTHYLQLHPHRQFKITAHTPIILLNVREGSQCLRFRVILLECAAESSCSNVLIKCFVTQTKS